jgi:hypothetical protein
MILFGGGEIDILPFIRFSGFPINRMLCLFFFKQYTIKYRKPNKHKKKKELALKDITIHLS